MVSAIGSGTFNSWSTALPVTIEHHRPKGGRGFACDIADQLAASIISFSPLSPQAGRRPENLQESGGQILIFECLVQSNLSFFLRRFWSTDKPKKRLPKTAPMLD